MDFHDRLLALRVNLGLTQEKFAELVGMSQRTVAAWEAGTRAPSFAKLCELADILNVSVEYILGRPDIPNIYIDTKKDPSPEERERAVTMAAAAVDGQYVNLFTDEEIRWLEQFVNTAIDRALSLRGIPSDDPTGSPDHNAQ